MKSLHRTAVPVLCAMLATGACTSTQKMARPLSPVAIREFDQSLNGRKARVDYEARVPEPVSVRVSGVISRHPSAPYLYMASEYGIGTIPWENIRQIKIKNRGKGALEGLLIGSGTGLILGLVGASRGSSGESNPDSMYAGKDMDLSGPIILVTAVLGAAIGAGIGAMVGHDNVFVF